MDDVESSSSLDVENFIWKGLNLYYLWQADVSDLSDTRFESQTQLDAYLGGYSDPETLFQSLLYKPISLYTDGDAVDKYSWIVSDYLELENLLEGTTTNSGVEFGLYKFSDSDQVYGVVRYIIPDSDASTKDIQRGDIFTGVDGTTLTTSNYYSLLYSSGDTYTLNLADYDSGTITANGESVSLTKTSLSENPIFINKVIVSGSHKIGYLMYNGFYSDYDYDLNDAFATLKSAGVTDFVLDLRYNSGGSILTATRLASMITGSYTGEVFAKQEWNDKIQSYYNSNSPESLINYFTDKISTTTINSIGMTTVYVLTTKSTASASELVINGLAPYINVVQIGATTTGKNVGSVTLYDSPTFGSEDRNTSHRYAMQPLVLKLVNADDYGDYSDGLVPSVALSEDISNFGVLGDTSEPLLSAAISKITGTSKTQQSNSGIEYNLIKDSKSINGIQNQMYLEKAPEGLQKALE
jgi:C-terminal processing protease CtpA/Prc